MNNLIFPQLFDVPFDRPDLSENQRRLSRTMHAVLVYTPVLLGFNALGIIVIYLLGLTGFLDKNDPRILIVGGTSLLASIFFIPLFSLLRRGQLIALSVFILLINSLGAVSQVLLWQGIVWFPLLLAIPPVLIFITHGCFTFLCFSKVGDCIRDAYREHLVWILLFVPVNHLLQGVVLQ